MKPAEVYELFWEHPLATDLHVHSTYSDGAGSPDEMVQAAIAQGMTRIGFSDHSYTAFDLGYSMTPENEPDYRAAVRALADKYRGQIEVLCGIEQDMYSEPAWEGYDYLIGSAHYVEVDGEFISVDDTPEILEAGCAKYFDGDYLALAREYYRALPGLVERTRPSFVGHFDVVAKFNEKRGYFDESAPAYVEAWKECADALLDQGVIFEVNTGAMTRGWRSVAYPAPAMLDYLLERGARFVLSSDSHRVDTLCAHFPQYFGKLEGAKRGAER